MKLTLVVALGALTAVSTVGAEEAVSVSGAQLEQQKQESRELLQSTVNLFPIEDASPVERGAEGQLLFETRTREGDEGLFLSPEVRFATPIRVELGLGAQLAGVGGEFDAGPAYAHAQAQLVRERGAAPAIGARVEVATPEDEAGWSGEGKLLATKSLGLVRVHGNAGYRVLNDTNDEYIVGLAVDRTFRERWLVSADAYLFDPLGLNDSSTLGADLGAGLRMTNAFVLTGAVGLSSTDGDTDPRFLVGLTGAL